MKRPFHRGSTKACLGVSSRLRCLGASLLPRRRMGRGECEKGCGPIGLAPSHSCHCSPKCLEEGIARWFLAHEGVRSEPHPGSSHESHAECSSWSRGRVGFSGKGLTCRPTARPSKEYGLVPKIALSKAYFAPVTRSPPYPTFAQHSHNAHPTEFRC